MIQLAAETSEREKANDLSAADNSFTAEEVAEARADLQLFLDESDSDMEDRGVRPAPGRELLTFPSKGESALYLTINCAGVREGASVVASGYPVAWNVEETEGGIMYVYFDF